MAEIHSRGAPLTRIEAVHAAVDGSYVDTATPVDAKARHLGDGETEVGRVGHGGPVHLGRHDVPVAVVAEEVTAVERGSRGSWITTPPMTAQVVGEGVSR